MTRFFVALIAASFAACTPETQDAVARETARATVTPILESRFPGVPVAPLANCVIDNATAAEIVTLASASLTGVTDRTRQVTSDILSRRETVRCIASEGLPTVLSQLR